MSEQLSPTNSLPYLVPLSAQNQEFDVSLSGVTYHLTVKWNPASNSWILYVADDQRNPLLSGIPLVAGCDLLEQFAYIGLDGAFVVQCSNDPNDIPDYQTLGSTGNLFFLIPVAPTVVG